MGIFTSFCLLTTMIVWVNCASKLPSYITPCKRDPNTLSDCALQETIKILPRILEGDKSFKIPRFDPFEFPEVNINAGNTLKIKLTDNVIIGFENHKVLAVIIDLEKKHVNLQFLFPRLNLVANYEIDGRIIALPINGKGPANITFVGGTYNYESELEFFKKKDAEYLRLINPTITYKTERNYFYLDNLFNDATLSAEMNKVLNENWETVTSDLGKPVADVISEVATTLCNNFFTRIPFDEIIPLP